MKYRLKQDIKALDLKKGDIFRFNKKGYMYTHTDFPRYYIGLPRYLVEDRPKYFELVEEERTKDYASELMDALENFRQHLLFLEKEYRR